MIPIPSPVPSPPSLQFDSLANAKASDYIRSITYQQNSNASVTSVRFVISFLNLKWPLKVWPDGFWGDDGTTLYNNNQNPPGMGVVQPGNLPISYYSSSAVGLYEKTVSGTANGITPNKTYNVSSPQILTLDAYNFYTYIKNGGEVLLKLSPAYGSGNFCMDVTTLLKGI